MMNPITQMKVAKSTTEPNKPFKAKLEGYLNDRKPTLTLGKGNGLCVLYTQINRQFQLIKTVTNVVLMNFQIAITIRLN